MYHMVWTSLIPVLLLQCSLQGHVLLSHASISSIFPITDIIRSQSFANCYGPR